MVVLSSARTKTYVSAARRQALRAEAAKCDPRMRQLCCFIAFSLSWLGEHDTHVLLMPKSTAIRATDALVFSDVPTPARLHLAPC
jgi:hypothetical protein